MDAEWLRKLCLAFPGVTEQIQWGYDLVFKVGGKMFAVTPLEPAPVAVFATHLAPVRPELWQYRLCGHSIVRPQATAAAPIRFFLPRRDKAAAPVTRQAAHASFPSRIL